MEGGEEGDGIEEDWDEDEDEIYDAREGAAWQGRQMCSCELMQRRSDGRGKYVLNAAVVKHQVYCDCVQLSSTIRARIN